MNQTANNTIYGLDVKTTIDNTTFLILNIAFEHFLKPLPRHSHGSNSYELHYIPNGRGQAVIDGTVYDLAPGTLYMTGPHVEHEQIPAPEDPMTEYSIYFRLQEEDNLRVPSGSTADRFLKKSFWIGQDTQRLDVLMEQLFYELKYKYTGYMIQVEALLQQCIVKVVRNYEGNRFSKQHFAPSNLIDGKTLIIERAFLYDYETITLEALAKTLGLSIRQTERFLKKYYGKTFQQKKQEARMSAAKIYLTDNRLSITQIAEKLNYSTSQHFTQAFKQHYGLTAHAYRRQLSEPAENML